MKLGDEILMPGGLVTRCPPRPGVRLSWENRLLGLFASWGYQGVVTPTFEYYEVLAPAMGTLLHDRLYRFIDDRGHLCCRLPDIPPRS